MIDQLITLVKIAGITLLITILWAFTLGIAYWDIQRRNQAGQLFNPFAWMFVVAFIPFIGLVGYLTVQYFSHNSSSTAQNDVQPGGRRETKFKMLPAERRSLAGRSEQAPMAMKPQPISLVSDLSNETLLSQQKSTQVERDPLASVQFLFSILRGPEQGKQFLVDHFPAQIGRDFDSVIRLDKDTGVSRKHALIYQINGALRIRDLSSRHGTRVNGEPVMDQILKSGDQIEVGLTSLSYQNIER